MAKCIYCPNEANSLEHHIPRALGNFKGYIPLINRVCKRCNGDFGRLDEQLCRSGGEAFFRTQIGITGRKEHEKVSSFYRGSAGGGRLQMVGTHPQTGSEVLLELIGENEVRELRCARLIAEDDTEHIIPIPNGMTPDEFRAKFDALTIKRFKHGNFFAAPEEMPWIETLLGKLNYESKTKWVLPSPGPILYGPSTITVTLTSRYFRCIAKIGFHYFLTKMPQFRGDEDCFTAIRHFIMNESNVDECNRFISYRQRQLAGELEVGNTPVNWGHLLSAESDYLNLKANVQLFVGPGSKPPIYAVHLGSNPSRIMYNEAHCDFFAYYPKEERVEFHGEVSELTSVQRN